MVSVSTYSSCITGVVSYNVEIQFIFGNFPSGLDHCYL